jgi:type VI protein secretion system component VasF
MTGATTHIGPGPRTLAKDRRSSQRRHPAATGTRVRRRPRQAPPPVSFYVLLVSVFVLCMLGLVMVLSASSIDALRQGTSG